MTNLILGLTKRIIVIDAETGSPVDLKKEGQYRYWEHPETETFMFAYLDHDQTQARLLDFEARNDVIPTDLQRAIDAPPEECMLAAANAPFDQAALRSMGIDTPDNKWIDILVMAYFLGFAGRLNDVLSQVGLQKKAPEGTRLITKFSMQRLPWWEHPGDWQKFRDYCVLDAEVEAQLLRWCLPYLEIKWVAPVYRQVHSQDVLYRQMNRNGIPVDMSAVRGAVKIMDQESGNLLSEMNDITGLENSNSRDQVLPWLQERIEILNMQKDHVRDTLLYYQEKMKDPFEFGDDRRGVKEALAVLELRQETGKSSTKKYPALQRATSDDGRLRGGWQFYAASRTGRVGGRVLNPANLPRPGIDNPEMIADLMQIGDKELLKQCVPGTRVMDTLSSCIRASLEAPEGKRWVVADLTSIESVGAGWLAGCDSILDIFFAGRDTYKTFAAEAEGISYDEVTKAQRTFYKPPVLAGAYGISGYGLVAYAAGMGVSMTEEEGQRLISQWRETYHEVVHYWRSLRTAYASAMSNPGTWYAAPAVDKVIGERVDNRGRVWKDYSYLNSRSVYFCATGHFLVAKLPSGSLIWYYRPSLEERKVTPRDGEPFTTLSLCYYGRDQDKGGWSKIATHPAKVFENLVQKLCRDVLWNAIPRVMADPLLELVLEVYDELGCLADADKAKEALKRLISYMIASASWMDDRFFLGAEGYIARRYKKD